MLAVLALQGPPLTSAQAGAITRTVSTFLVPPDRAVGSHGAAGRVLVFDRDRSAAAFAHLVQTLNPRDLGPPLPAVIMKKDDAITCTKGGKSDCTVARNSVFLSVDTVERGSAADTYLVVATALWGEPRAGGGHKLDGGTYRLTVALRGTKWKHWEVIRSVPKPKY